MMLLPLLLAMALIGRRTVYGATVCPPEGEIEPCTCVQNDSPTDVSLDCLGSSVSEEVIVKLFSAIRSANNITSSLSASNVNGVNGTGQSNQNETESIHDFHIRGTNLTSINLTPLLGWQFVALYIYQNPRLTNFNVLGKKNSTSKTLTGQISAENVEVDTNFLGDEGLAQLLPLLTPDVLSKLVLRENKIRTIPSLDPFSQLTDLDLSYNLIQEIGGGQFKNLTRLQRLDLKSNLIHSIKKDAFLFEAKRSNVEDAGDDDPSDEEDEVLSIYLDSNKLSDSGVHPGHGLETVQKRAGKLYLRKNNFEYISALNFDPFLKREGHYNLIKLWGNPIVCDQKLIWLRSNKESFFYEGRVHGVDCINHAGKTIFTTDVVVD